MAQELALEQKHFDWLVIGSRLMLMFFMSIGLFQCWTAERMVPTGAKFVASVPMLFFLSMACFVWFWPKRAQLAPGVQFFVVTLLGAATNTSYGALVMVLGMKCFRP